MNHFQDGDRPSLEEVLENRESRRRRIDRLLADRPETTVVCFKLNIPGPVKNNQWLRKLFREGLGAIEEALDLGTKTPVVREIFPDLPTGPEAFLVLDRDTGGVKRDMVALEDHEVFGRFYDIDVEGGPGSIRPGAVSREDLGLSERKCFLCNQPAKVCASSRAHAVEDMVQFIEESLAKEGFFKS